MRAKPSSGVVFGNHASAQRARRHGSRHGDFHRRRTRHAFPLRHVRANLNLAIASRELLHPRSRTFHRRVRIARYRSQKLPHRAGDVRRPSLVRRARRPLKIFPRLPRIERLRVEHLIESRFKTSRVLFLRAARPDRHRSRSKRPARPARRVSKPRATLRSPPSEPQLRDRRAGVIRDPSHDVHASDADADARARAVVVATVLEKSRDVPVTNELARRFRRRPRRRARRRGRRRKRRASSLVTGTSRDFSRTVATTTARARASASASDAWTSWEGSRITPARRSRSWGSEGGERSVARGFETRRAGRAGRFERER
mmetsp:Transcript_635/g.2627  ORF Transcript_635/g.2627 Transcript_635/m.2627 type:complete len:315 (+) Transcript_635:2758-3702(+)